MPLEQTQKLNDFRIRARLPHFLRYLAIAAIGIAVLVVAIGLYRERSSASFRLKGEHAQLSKDVVLEVNGYERLESEDGINKYLIKAEHAKTFSDQHQELDNVFIEAYGKDGLSPNKLTADAAIYIPDNDKNFTAYLKGNVKIETADGLNVRSNSITYTRANDTAESDEIVEFQNENIKGRSLGALARLADKQIELMQNVEIETFETAELLRSNIRSAKMNSTSATFDQAAGKVSLRGNVEITVRSGTEVEGRVTDFRASEAVASFATFAGESTQIKKFELVDNVRIVTAQNIQESTTIDAGYAMYDKSADRFELKNGTHIVTIANEKATDIRSSEAVFEQSGRKLELIGGVEITQGGDFLKGDAVYANLFPGNKIKDAIVRGSAYARQEGPERNTAIRSSELNAEFDQPGSMRRANSIGQSTVELAPKNELTYSRVDMKALKGIGIAFRGAGELDAIRTDGRTTINLSVPNNRPDAANKTVTADTVRTTFAANGKDLKSAEAVGNAVLSVEPLNASPQNYRTTINAPRFDCEFFGTGNNVKRCVGGKRAKAVRVPTVPTDRRGEQILQADLLAAEFNPGSNDLERIDADGSAKFSELDRNALAANVSFSNLDETVRLRGGEPTVWDSRGRAKAKEIDWNTREDRSYLRGGVSTTYYSRKQMKDSTPFATSDKPVYATADSAEFDHSNEKAVYVGKARAWQENNYVRGNRLVIDQAAGRLLADGDVQSLLYNAKIRQRGKESLQPVSASAGSMTYDRDQRLLQYKKNVDIRQGTDRITSESADIHLSNTNEVMRTVVETAVVITQPGRKATGDWAQYTSVDESAIIRGNPAFVTDAESGSTQGTELRVYLRDNRVINDGRSKQNTSGRIRSVYKTKPNQ